MKSQEILQGHHRWATPVIGVRRIYLREGSEVFVNMGAEKLRAEIGEDSRTDANAESQRRDHNDGQHGVFTQAARRISHILPQRFQMVSHANLPNLLFDLFLAAKLDQRRAARLRRIETRIDLLLDEHLKINVNLIGQLLFLPGLAEQVTPETR